MKVSKDEIAALQEWLGTRLDALLAHGDRVRELLRAADAQPGSRTHAAGVQAENIIKSAAEMLLGEPESERAPLSPAQLAVWKSLLPIVSEHGLLALKAGGLALAEDAPLGKKEAAEFLGLTVRKLEVCMKKRQIEYQKYGTGKSASVRFMRSELERFRKSRNVSAKTVSKK